jgi:hypothetical protein
MLQVEARGIEEEEEEEEIFVCGTVVGCKSYFNVMFTFVWRN